jgi:hypothetical protein
VNTLLRVKRNERTYFLSLLSCPFQRGRHFSIICFQGTLVFVLYCAKELTSVVFSSSVNWIPLEYAKDVEDAGSDETA